MIVQFCVPLRKPTETNFSSCLWSAGCINAARGKRPESRPSESFAFTHDVWPTRTSRASRCQPNFASASFHLPEMASASFSSSHARTNEDSTHREPGIIGALRVAHRAPRIFSFRYPQPSTVQGFAVEPRSGFGGGPSSARVRSASVRRNTRTE